VAQDLNQGQATEIVAVLNAYGISAQAARETGGKGRYRVEVKRSSYSEAIALLYKKGLPSEIRPSFSELIAQSGLLPNSREIEALRSDRAVAVQIEETLQNNPAVMSARVLIRRDGEARNRLNGDAQVYGAAAVLVERPGLKIDKDEVLQVISMAVPGVQRDRIYVSVHQALPEEKADPVEGSFNLGGVRSIRVPLTRFLWFWRVPEDEYRGLALVFVGSVIVVLLLGGMIGFWVAYYRQVRRGMEVGFGEGAGSSRRSLVGRGERTRKDLPGPPG